MKKITKQLLFIFCTIYLISCSKNDSDINSVTIVNLSDGNEGDNQYGVVSDVDGNTYKTVTIGTQTWMAENLRAVTYADGTAIPNITDNIAWGNLGDNDTDKAYCWYDNDINNKNTYGALYTYAAATNGDNSGENVQGVCPVGWHLPGDEEWKTLEMELGMSQADADKDGLRGTNEGVKLAGNANLWTDGTLDSHAEFGMSGFTALPGGSRHATGGSFRYVGDGSDWWSSTQRYSSLAYNRILYYSNADVTRISSNKSFGFYVRCVKD